MPKHLWMQDLAAVAYCPKCKSAAFKRSNTKSGYEKLIRRYTDKVPYRCHECGYRSLIDQTRLQFPASSQRQFEEHEDFTSDVELPTIRIATIMENDTDNSKSRAKKSGEKPGRPKATATPPATLTASPGRPVNPSSVDASHADSESPLSLDKGKAIFPDFKNERGEQDAVMMPMRAGSKVHPASCPSCGEKALHRSHSRSIMESAIKRFSRRRLYRCHSCSWRGWLPRHA